MFLLAACGPATDSPPEDTGADLVSLVPAGAVRAGVVTDEAALLGGISAEGRLGDVKLVNAEAAFLVQQPGDSSYYVEYGGGLIDADLVRQDGAPGRDLLDEAAVMVGLGRVVDVQTVTVSSDGSDGAAVVRTEGPAAPMRLITGALESDAVVPDLDLWITTTYTLRPDVSWLEIETTVENRESSAQALTIGDVALVALDVAEPYVPGNGREGAGLEAVDWTAVVAHENELTVALLGEDAPLEQGTVGQILGTLASSVAGFSPAVEIDAGGTSTFRRRLGVGLDPASLSAAQIEWRGAAATVVSGVARTAAGAPVPGARVHVLDGSGDPLTLAFAGEDGAWSATVAEGAAGEVVVSGRGRGYVADLPAGAGWYSPYGARNAEVLETLRSGAPAVPFAEGCGVSARGPASSVVLPGCGTVRVTIADGGPAVVRLYPEAGDTAVVDDRLVPGRPDGAATIGFVRDGAMDLPVEPGRYVLVAHRGVRDESWSGSVVVEDGQALDVRVDLARAWDVPGLVSFDPHSHAAPSGDGGISMEDRLLVTAANGVDVHVGTDHDHVADYRPLIEPLGLSSRLRSIVADEVSPVLRGHFNVFPAQLREGPNHGAPRWWLGYADTEEIFGWMRALAGPRGIVSVNHPLGSSGMFSHAGYDPVNGTIASPDHWSAGFDAMEVVNDSDWEQYFPYYLDLVRRGHPVVPVGVSDSHGHTSGDVGLAQTFLLTGGTLATFDDAVLLDTMRRGAVVVSHGPYLDVRVGDAWAPGKTFHGDRVVARVVAYAPSWMPVDEVTLWRDGTPVQTWPCTGAAPRWCEVEVVLTAERDASVVFTAGSVDRVMAGGHPGSRAWAMAAASFLDVDADGTWTPPYPPLGG